MLSTAVTVRKNTTTKLCSSRLPSPHTRVRYDPFDSELPPTAYHCVAPLKSREDSALSIAAWSRSMLLCWNTSDPGMYPAIGTVCVHADVLGSAPTCAHVMPRHGYVSSNAPFTNENVGYVPASYSPNFWFALIVAADAGLQ